MPIFDSVPAQPMGRKLWYYMFFVIYDYSFYILVIFKEDGQNLSTKEKNGMVKQDPPAYSPAQHLIALKGIRFARLRLSFHY